MIQYIIAAGLGALIGSAQKGKKKYKKGGSVMKKDPATKNEILRQSDGIMDDADDLIRIADKKRLYRDDKMGIQTLADEMKFRAGNIYDTAQRKLAKGGEVDLHSGGYDVDEILRIIRVDSSDSGLGFRYVEDFVEMGAFEWDKNKINRYFDEWVKEAKQFDYGEGQEAQEEKEGTIREIEQERKGALALDFEDDFFLDEKIGIGLDDDALDFVNRFFKINEKRLVEVAPQVFRKWMARGGTTMGVGKSGLDKIKKTSKENPSQMYMVTDDNNFNIGRFYLKNGKFAKKTVANAAYDFFHNKVSLRPKSDVIYKAIEIEGKGGYYAKGGQTEISREAVVEALRDPIEEMMEEVAETYEFYGSEINVEEIEHESRAGFIPFTDGGIVAQFFGIASTYIGSGIRMPTNTLQAELERLENKAYEYADENTDDEEARWEEIDEYLSDASIMFSCEAQYYAPDNDRGEDGKHTIALAGVVNMEGPYHRRGKFEDFKEIIFTFSSIKDLEKKLESNLEKIKAWFDGDEFEKGRKLKFAKGGCTSCGKRGRKMADGGRVGDKDFVLNYFYVDVYKDDGEGRLGLVGHLFDGDAEDYGESKLSFSSKSALMDFIKKVIDRETSEDDTKESNFDIESDEDGTTINYGVWCKPTGNYDPNYEKATREEIEQWKKGDLELFMVRFTFEVKVFEPRRRAEFARGGKTQGYNARLDESLAMRRGSKRKKKQGYKSRRDESAGMERSMGRRKYASVGTMDKGRRRMARGGRVEYLLYGVAQGKPDYMEKILFVDDKPIRITEKLRDMASAKGFDRLRTSMVDLKIAPDFTKALNFKKGGKTKGRKKVSDFDKLAMKVAARYRAQGMSNKKAMEIGRGTAGKVARQQQAKKRKK